MKSDPKTSEEFDRFTALVDAVLAVPPSEVLKLQQEQKATETKRSPKPHGSKRP